MSKFGANLMATFNMSPKGSHAVILGLVCAFIIAMGSSFAFLWFKPERCLLPFSCSAVLLIVIIILWFKSHKDVDSQTPVPTSFLDSDGTNITKITTDIRSSEGMKLMECLLSMAQYRRPLPDADGMVDNKGNPMPESESEARARIKFINSQVKEAADYVFSRLRTFENHQSLEQHRLPHEPESDEISETNRSVNEP